MSPDAEVGTALPAKQMMREFDSPSGLQPTLIAMEQAMPKHHFSEAERAELAASTAQLAVAADALERARAVIDAVSLSFGANSRAKRPAARKLAA